MAANFAGEFKSLAVAGGTDRVQALVGRGHDRSLRVAALATKIYFRGCDSYSSGLPAYSHDAQVKSKGERRRWDSNPRVKVLQTSALPLGYVARSASHYTLRQCRFKDELAWLVRRRPTKGQFFVQIVKRAIILRTL